MNVSFFYIFFIIVSIVCSFFSSNWLLLWLWLELSSLCLIPIISKVSNLRSIESTIKYYIFQALGSVILLFGILIRCFFLNEFMIFGNYNIFVSFFIVLGLSIKIGIFPLHFWFIDVVSGLKFYEGAFVVIISKVIPLYLLMVVGSFSNSSIYWVEGMISVVVGSFFGLSQIQLRKLIGLSSVAHLGWLIILFPYLSLWISGFLFLVYVVMSFPLFVIGSLYSSEHFFKVKNVWNNFSFSFIFCISILSLAGFPPLVGFFYKWIMLYFLVINDGYVTVAILIILSLISLYFYLNLFFTLVSLSWPNLKFLLSSSYYYGNLKEKVFFVFFVFVNLLIFFLMLYVGPLNVEFIFPYN
uniref:NADH-ubiquinone oxidoreductase chain 2 n=1 Tax=Astrospartus mediterraneus TaxID=691888 RepID=D3H5X5_ASTMD|nr:NADH dehydrogenase subunit 2 [Astrospartus mediterraneus]CBH40149.1 NADH dehydrogenase subunit 2 [Astrospartus mediterraneus]